MAVIPAANIVSRSEAYSRAAKIVSRLQDSGFAAYFVGGCVRDLFLGFSPQDYDIATDARPEDVKRLFPGTSGIGRNFGVSTVRSGSCTVEVAAFREDGPYFDHRRPAWVTYAGLEEDARRRDFTLNALYYDPVSQRVEDPVAGMPDLERRILRVIGDPFERLDEDWLRLLRAVRFAARFALRFDLRTWDALRALAPMVSGIVAERQTEEIRLMLQGPNAGRALGLLHSSGLWQNLWPDLPFSAERIRKISGLLQANASPADVWKCFFTDLPQAMVKTLARRLKLTRLEKKSLNLR